MIKLGFFDNEIVNRGRSVNGGKFFGVDWCLLYVIVLCLLVLLCCVDFWFLMFLIEK